MRKTFGLFLFLTSLCLGISTSQAGEIVRLEIARLHPTQTTISEQEIDDRVGKLKAMSSDELKEYLKEKRGEAILGPGEIYWLLDGHHLALALYRLGYKEIEVEVTDDWSELKESEVLSQLAEEDLLWLYDENGEKIKPKDVPDSLLKLKNDPYRYLAWRVRHEGAIKKPKKSKDKRFAEFKWANHFRKHIPSRLLKEDFDAALETAVRIAQSPDSAELPGYIGESEEKEKRASNRCKILLSRL